MTKCLKYHFESFLGSMPPNPPIGFRIRRSKHLPCLSSKSGYGPEVAKQFSSSNELNAIVRLCHQKTTSCDSGSHSMHFMTSREWSRRWVLGKMSDHAVLNDCNEKKLHCYKKLHTEMRFLSTEVAPTF